jgi:hypothetical protein
MCQRPANPDIETTIRASMDAVLHEASYDRSLIQAWSVDITGRVMNALEKIMPKDTKFTASCLITCLNSNRLVLRTPQNASTLRISWRNKTLECIVCLCWFSRRSNSLPELDIVPCQ